MLVAYLNTLSDLAPIHMTWHGYRVLYTVQIGHACFDSDFLQFAYINLTDYVLDT